MDHAWPFWVGLYVGVGVFVSSVMYVVDSEPKLDLNDSGALVFIALLWPLVFVVVVLDRYVTLLKYGKKTFAVKRREWLIWYKTKQIRKAEDARRRSKNGVKPAWF